MEGVEVEEEEDLFPVRTVGDPAKGRHCASRTNTSTSSASSVKVCNGQLSPLTSTVSPDDSHNLKIDCVCESEALVVKV